MSQQNIYDSIILIAYPQGKKRGLELHGACQSLTRRKLKKYDKEKHLKKAPKENINIPFTNIGMLAIQWSVVRTTPGGGGGGGGGGNRGGVKLARPVV